MVRVATDAVSESCAGFPHRKRLSVKTVTTDLSSAMMLTVRKVFRRKADHDRFHVQQLASEAVDQLRIRHGGKYLMRKNQAIREHRQKKKEAKRRQARATGKCSKEWRTEKPRHR